MAITYGFYDSYNGDRKYTAGQISSMFDGLITDGVFEEIDEKFMTIPSEGMQVIVKSGKAWFDHTWLINDAWYTLTIPKSDITRDRWDAIVLETNHDDTVRRSEIKVIQGEPSYAPVKPTMVTGALINQHPLAYVKVRASTTVILASDIEIRVGFSDCPFITGLLQVTSLDDLFNAWNQQFHDFQESKEQDYQSFLDSSQKVFNDWMLEQQTSFMTWWDGVKSVLDTDTAAKLSEGVRKNKEAIETEVAMRQSEDLALGERITNLSSTVDTKQNRIDTVGMLKGTGAGRIEVAQVGVDYASAQVGDWRIVFYNQSGSFIAPSNIMNPAHVMCFGGGGGPTIYLLNKYPEVNNSSIQYSAPNIPSGLSICGKAGSGYFVEKDLNLEPNYEYSIEIGSKGELDRTVTRSSANTFISGTSGGVTRFSNLLSASGGSPANGRNGGNGGAGGGGGDGVSSLVEYQYEYIGRKTEFLHGGNGGNGAIFGGGGGGIGVGEVTIGSDKYYGHGGNGGNGGTYGGGGGAGGCGYSYSQNTNTSNYNGTSGFGKRGKGGTYGGDGGGPSTVNGFDYKNAEPGKNMPLSLWHNLLNMLDVMPSDIIFSGGEGGRSTSSGTPNYKSGGGGGGYSSFGNSCPSSVGGAFRGGGGGGYGLTVQTQYFNFLKGSCFSGSAYGHNNGYSAINQYYTNSTIDITNKYNNASIGNQNSGNYEILNLLTATATQRVTMASNAREGLCIIFYRLKDL